MTAAETIAGCAGLTITWGVFVAWPRARRVDRSERRLGLDAEHNRQVALGVTDVRTDPTALDRAIGQADDPGATP